ncbi:MAG: ribosome-associated translation inhibitor RaiA [Candidatus Hydrogenedentes bacterium]|nr:ribosome-associated translation inhibitor RaiA [Candidatus Hydrogenedentota bacterium]
MRVTMTGRHMEMTDALKAYVENRIKKIREHFEDVIDVDVVLSVEKHRHIAEINLHANGIRIHGKESSADMYASVDAVLEKLERQVRKYRDRINRYQPRKGLEMPDYHHNIIEYADEEAGNGKNTAVKHRVILREKLPMKPMNVEEATMQLELVNDDFLVFSNADTQQINVIYAREDGTYGLIEPQF